MNPLLERLSNVIICYDGWGWRGREGREGWGDKIEDVKCGIYRIC